MPAGGARPGAGRPRKEISSPKQQTECSFPVDVVAQSKANPGMTPLEYMLTVMRNPDVPDTRRDRMAVAAAPYCHGKIAEQYETKKKRTHMAAAATAKETEWGVLVQH